MLNNFQKSLQYVLESEGGFSDNVADSGGATMKGIILDTYRLFKKNAHLTPNDLKNISDDDISTIYFKSYWNACKCSELPNGIDYLMLDASCNTGVNRAIKTLQKSVGADVDGNLGSITLALVNKHDISDLIRTFSDQKEAFYHYLVGSKPSQEVFLKGWLSRIATVKDRALKMV